MFGLENKRKHPKEEFFFELEKELKGPTKYKELLQKIEERIQHIKEALRAGEEQQDYQRFGTLLHGYTSLLKVISRVVSKK
jgi:Family of unknown function (DUF5398)